jgi:rfaE bifunctional protein kinase chain/domain
MQIDIDRLSKEYAKKNILVIGDIILDAYIYGKVDRISQEAPVPIVAIDRKKFKPGGAANVALNLSGLGANVQLLGVTGDDNNARELQNCFQDPENIQLHLVKDKSRATIVKTRIIADGKQVVRLDEEITSDIDFTLIEELIKVFNENCKDIDGIIVEDYNKGTLPKAIISHVVSYSSHHDIPVYVDPKYDNYEYFKGVRLFKPNLLEYNAIVRNKQFGDLPNSGFKFKEFLESDILLLTLGADGMSLYHNGQHNQIPTKARKVYDVSGAGDTVIATFAINDLCGLEPLESSTIANLAAGRVCEEIGVFPITVDSLKEIFSHHYNMD